MPRLSAKAKILITVFIPSIQLGPIVILVAALSLHIILRIAVVYLTLITLIYFVIKSTSEDV
jgi:hypothetical protein